jgi:hypothetical protein
MLVLALVLIAGAVFVLIAGVAIIPALLPVALIGVVIDQDGRPIQQVLTPDDAAGEIAAGPSIAPRPLVGLGRGRPSQFKLGLGANDALAACGPAAALGFAFALGMEASPAQVMAVARRGWWDANVGMHGVGAEQGMLRDLGLPSALEAPVRWQHVAAEASSSRPVILDTPGHYYFVDGFDAPSGRLHVGTSGTDLRGGADWMTPAQINAMAVSKGSVRAALYVPVAPIEPGKPS